MRVTITGSPSQIESACKDILQAIPVRAANRSPSGNHGGRGRQLSPENQERYGRIVAQRRILRQAFDLVRYDPTEKAVVDNLAKALGGKVDITGTLLETARQIIRTSEDKPA